MAQFGKATFADFKTVQDTITRKISSTKSFEEASQHYTTTIYDTFKESIVLIRQFITVPYQELPVQNQTFVSTLASSKSVNELLHPHTLVLSLVGSSGAEPTWNDRKNSQGHVGIPLVSAAFIGAIPMMSRLLKQLGLGLEWIDSHDTAIAEQTMGLMSGLFFVADATREVDTKGRKIIAAQDFVAQYHVRTVCGFGGGYLGTKTMIVTIIFLRDDVPKRQVELFASSMARFRTMTGKLVKTCIFTA